ncbi:MAG: tetratricopeptide repeat protein [Nitrospirae bacterium]|nr:tetratricopeptide repeat protein [Nitrospirota bacterium]
MMFSVKLRNYASVPLFLVYLLVGIAVYSKVILYADFVFDDFQYIVGNPLIQDFSFLLRSTGDPRQLGYLSFSLNYLAAGENPMGYHLVNVIVHIINGMLVFMLARLLLELCGLTDARNDEDILFMLPAAAGLLFIVHPMQTQAVSYVTQRFTSLSVLFYLSSVVCYLRARKLMEGAPLNFKAWLFYGLALACTAAAMKVKEISFTIPLVLVMLEMLLVRPRCGLRRSMYMTAPFLAALAIIPLAVLGPDLGLIDGGSGIAEITRREKVFDLTARPVSEYFATQTRVLVSYLRLLVFPYNQSVVYDVVPSKSLSELRVIVSVLFHLSALAAALLCWIGSRTASRVSGPIVRFLALGVGWFYITASVESSFIPIKDLMFEHRMYLPLVGFSYVFLSLLMLLVVRSASEDGKRLKWFVTTVFFLSVVLGLVSYSRNDIWLSEFNLWDDVVAKIPNKAIGYHNRGNAVAKMGRLDLAIEDMNRAINLFEGYIGKKGTWESSDYTPTNMAKAYMNRATIFSELGEHERARADMQTARKMVSMPLIRLEDTRKRADLFFKKGAYGHAIEEYNNIIAWFPEDYNALNDRGNAYSMSGRYKEAIADFDRVIQREPDRPLTYHNRGIARAWNGDGKGALTDFEKACAMGFGPACESAELVRQGKK